MEEKKSSLKRRFLFFIILYAVVFLAVLWISNLSQINGWMTGVIRILRPILVGLIVAYICNPFFRLFERRVFFRVQPAKLRRTLSLLFAFLSILLILGLLLLLILPQLIESIATFATHYDTYISSGIAQLNKIIDGINAWAHDYVGNEALLSHVSEEELRKSVAEFFGQDGESLMEQLQSIDLTPVVDALGETASALADLIIGIFIAIYLLSTKEKRYAQIMKLRRALLNERINTSITRICTIANRSFGGFLQGKLLDSLIVGILVYIVIALCNVPYAILIASILAVTNLIPVIGPFIGAVPSVFIILLAHPEKAILFLIIVVIIQQIDSNIIAPKILGDNTGVSPLCVLIAITIMGSLWGFIGMLLGVPLFATVLELMEIYIVERLQKKGRPSGLSNYYAPDSVVDPEKDVQSGNAKILHRLEQNYLRTSKRLDADVTAPLTKKEKFNYRLYLAGRKLHLFPEISEEALIRYAVTVSIKDADTASDISYESRIRESERAEEESPAENAPVEESR